MNARTPLAFTVFALVVASAALAEAQPRVPRFEPGPCAFAPGDWARTVRLECGVLVVAQDREHPERKLLRLAVAVLRTAQPSSQPPLAILHGGPSGPGGLRASSMALAVRWFPVLNRDIVVYDLRGVGFSEPVMCPDVAAESPQRRNEVSEAERERGYLEAARACVASLEKDGIDPHLFNSATNAADLLDLRTSLGYQRWDLFGSSYGSRLAQEAMRRDPAGVRSVVLDSPMPPGVAKAEDPLSIQRAIERIFAECAASAACRAAFPAPEEDLNALYAELSAKPMEVVVEREGAPFTVHLNGRRMVADIIGRFSIEGIDRLPLLLHQLRSGDRAAAARILVGNGVGTGALNNVVTQLVNCYDVVGEDLPAAVARVKSQLKEPFRLFAFDEALCRGFLRRFAAPADHELVRSDIPALIISKQFDDRTPTEHGRRIAAALSHAYLFELPGLGHAQTPAGCFDTIVARFLNDPTRSPDAACIATMPRLAFETGELERPTLFFTITAADAATSPFAGTWEAAFPGAPRPFTFALTVADRLVNGNITAGGGALTLGIFDGTVDDRRIVFKVKSPDGGRTITFSGTIDGARITFIRDVDVPPGADAGGAGIWGASGARTFTARRTQ